MHRAQFSLVLGGATLMVLSVAVIAPIKERPAPPPLPDERFFVNFAAPELGLDRPVEPLADKVRRAIDDAVKYLKLTRRKADGSWQFEIARANHGGAGTALVLLALLTAEGHYGEEPRDPVMREALAFLRRQTPEETYAVSLQTMVLSMVGNAADMNTIQRNVDWLIKARGANGWGYHMGDITLDNSNSQYALLALHEALQAGAKVDAQVLTKMREVFIETQDRNGGWGYQPRKGEAPIASMVFAGLSNLMITGIDLDENKQGLKADGSAAQCGAYADDTPVARALNWIGRLHPGNADNMAYERFFQRNVFYALYGLERVGRFTGQRFIGGKDWYRLGCEYLTKTQQRDGYWKGGGIAAIGSDDALVCTSFALLFLAKGRTPVLISKLAHGQPRSNEWNRKHSDMRNLVEFCSRELFKRNPMAWQVFDVRDKDAGTEEQIRELAAELLQSPIVFINGHEFRPTETQKNLLKIYIENGGFIVAEACCGDANFNSNFRDFVSELFGDGSLTRVEASHAVWDVKFRVDPNKFPLYQVSQGCRTVLLYSPKPLAGYWEANLYKGAAGEKEIRGKMAFELGANIVAYATGLTPPKPRLSEVAVNTPDEKGPDRTNVFRVAQLSAGEPRPAPRAMRNLMEEARKAGLDVVLETKEFHPANRAINDYWFFYMHGRNEFHLTADELKPLKQRLEGLGTLLADACCGSEKFDKSFRDMMTQMWGEKGPKLEPIPPNDPLFSAELNGQMIEKVNCRRPAGDGQRGRPEMQSVPPALEGIKLNGRWVVIYSKYDIGCALEKAPSAACYGHDYESAVKLARAAVLYALRY